MTWKLSLKDPTLLRDACLVAGEWIAADSGGTIAVDNPSTGAVIGHVPNMGAAEARRAIEFANAALPAWRARTAKERAGILRRWFDLMMANQDDLGAIMTAEQGKPFTEAKGEIAYAASFIEWFGEEVNRIYGDTIPGFTVDRRIIVLKQPIGVCAAITPWNFPAAMITRKAGSALATGCTIVVKPASQTPLSALALAALAERAEVPKGVLSVVTGSASAIGGEMTSNPIVRKVTFTGSTEIGKKADGAERINCEADVDGTRRKRALHGLRRRGHRSRSQGRDGVEIPQCRPNLRLRQSHPGAGQDLRHLCRATGRGG
jgi:succinate-semialdehyde dehydrogenase / glutarate-semialdehyde dehydrogenase